MFSTHNEQGLLEQRVFRAAVKQEDMMVICNAPDEQRLLLALRQQPEQGLAAAIEQYGGLVGGRLARPDLRTLRSVRQRYFGVFIKMRQIFNRDAV